MNKIKQFLLGHADADAGNSTQTGTNIFSLKRLQIAVVAGLIITIIAGQFTVFATDCEQIRGNTLRLHIIANSNEQGDQEIKLLVRDKILQEHGELFLQATNKADAKWQVEKNLAAIEATASLAAFGSDVEVSICKDFFNTRAYEDFTLPAGVYDAVRIKIGAAKGKNWWCVLYPALCLPAATKDKKLDVLTDNQADIINNPKKYKVAFLSVELLEKLKNKLSQIGSGGGK